MTNQTFDVTPARTTDLEMAEAVDLSPYLGGFFVIAQSASHTGNIGTPSDKLFQDTFKRLAAEWRDETGMFSSISKKTVHSAYRAIIDMGEQVVPLILRDLKERPDHWFMALKTITGADPVPRTANVTFEQAAEAWIAWGRARNLIAE